MNKITSFPQGSEEAIFNSTTPLRVKLGFDPTGSRLHLGHLAPIRIAQKLAQRGHHIVIILGTLTGRLGDPSGQDQTRPLLSKEESLSNAEALQRTLEGFFPDGFEVHQNHTFVDEIDIPFFLTRLAAKVNVAQMLSRDGFRRRIENGNSIALHELLVPLLQGFDSVKVRADVEIGGTDQLFNFQIARLLQESEGQKKQVCLFAPIVAGTDGKKASKSAGNAIFLDEHPNEIFGKILSTSDEVAGELIQSLTDLDQLPDHPLERKKLLAFDLVSQIHGVEAAKVAQENFEATVQRKELPQEIDTIEADSLLNLVVKIRSCSRAQGRKLIVAGGVKVNGEKVTDVFANPSINSILQVGKRDFARISGPDGDKNTLV
jgi:tyrosyl-tRNA synthetase